MRSPVTNGCRFILTISGLSMHLILNQALFPLNSGPVAVRLLQLRIAPSGLLLNRAKPQLLFKPPLQVFSRQATCGLFQWSFALDKDQLAQKRHKEGQRHTQCLYWELAPLSLWFRPIACEYIRMVLQKQSFRFFFFMLTVSSEVQSSLPIERVKRSACAPHWKYMPEMTENKDEMCCTN